MSCRKRPVVNLGRYPNYSQRVLMVVTPLLRGLRARIVALAAVLLVGAGTVTPVTAFATGPLTPKQAPLPGNSSSVPQAILNAVTCPTTQNCTAVGRYESTSGGRALVLSRSGGPWGSPHSVTLPANALAAANGVLNGLFCFAKDECVAVGQYERASSYEGMIVAEHHGAWGTAIQSPLPPGALSATITALNAISCTSRGNCIAVGQFRNNVGDQGFIVRERAGVWGHPLVSPLPNRNKPNFITQLDGVACTSVGYCVAVGQYVNTTPSRQAMIVTERAGVWSSSVAAVLPVDAQLDPWAGLLGVTCVSRGYCVAVGIYQGPHGGQGLISVESGGNWRRGIQAPLPSGSSPGVRSDQLLAVTCTTFGNCHAVGQFTFGSLDYGVVITEIHGHWGRGVRVPRPANGISPIYAGLNGIDCINPTTCQMVGQYQSTLGEPALIVSQ